MCGLYDVGGVDKICVVPNKPCCSGCGCAISYKTRALSSCCTLKDLGRYPMWEAELTEAEEKKFREKTGLKNES